MSCLHHISPCFWYRFVVYYLLGTQEKRQFIDGPNHCQGDLLTRRGIGLKINRVDHQTSLPAGHLSVNAPNESVTVQYGHNVVPVLTLRLRYVNLGAVLEVEQHFCSGSITNEVVKR